MKKYLVLTARKGNPMSVRSAVKMKLVPQLRANRLIPVLLSIILLLFFYLLCLQMGAGSWFFSFLARVGGVLGVKALSVILMTIGCPATLALWIGGACRALVTSEAGPSLAHWVSPGPSHQPHVAEEFPQEGPRDVATRSAPPVGIEIKKPLLCEEQREEELSDRLNHHFRGHFDQINRIAFDDLIEKQSLIEEKLQMALLNEEYTRERILANRFKIRECLFYQEGVPLKEKTLDLYLKQIQGNPFESIPYRKIQQSIKNFEIFFPE